ncbi:ATP-binding cassette domain-containing protein [Paenibacillus aquistagni]|uniref:Energy-coupling factor transport system ATP-binding protein n=1 Tax=Paenibacillus aquistagni TaxID=1852522 RepID=A0A1X7LBI7_9BACL|nr:ABC transporter ATP-binding protein [Paenibacillus aquistagni]SMG51191.1 energy-coupling factor transport system ATP-binding protein [Paenibacillus aquistagni]
MNREEHPSIDSIHDLGAGEVIRMSRVAFTYVGEDQATLEECSFTLREGEVHVIFGRNGTGKTTLAKLLAGLLESHEGNCTGELATREDKLIGYIGGDAASQFVIGIVEDELAFGPENLAVVPSEIERRIDAELDAFKMAHHRFSHVDTLSGGEQQRAAAMSIWTMEPDVLIIDDGWSQLDVEGRAELYEKLRCWMKKKGRSLLLLSSRLGAAEGGLEADELLERAKRWRLEAGRLQACDQDEMRMAAAEAKRNEHRVETVEAAGYSCPAVPITEHRQAILALNQVRVRYKGQDKEVLQQVTGVLHAGECALLQGHNGAGKSTLFRLISGGLKLQGGSVMLGGEPLSRMDRYDRARALGYAPQRAAASFLADSVWDEGMLVYQALQALPQAQQPLSVQAEPDASRWLEKELMALQLFALRHRHPEELSLASQRKLSLWIASAHEPSLLLLDEPTAGLDAAASLQVMDWCEHQRSRGAAVLIITHDPLWEAAGSRDCYRRWRLEGGILHT